MANFVYVAAGSLMCGHGGSMTPGSLTSTHKLTVQGQRVVTADNVTAATIVPALCSQQTTTATPSNVPCSTILSVTSPLAKKLTVNGTPAVIDTLAGTTNGLPLNSNLTGLPGQAKLTAGST